MYTALFTQNRLVHMGFNALDFKTKSLWANEGTDEGTDEGTEAMSCIVRYRARVGVP